MRISDFLLCKVGEGELIPKGYGLAWREFDKAESIFLPIPINIIASFMRTLYWRMIMAFYPAKIDILINKIETRAMQEGYTWGRKDGFRAGIIKTNEEINKRFDEFLATKSENRDKLHWAPLIEIIKDD